MLHLTESTNGGKRMSKITEMFGIYCSSTCDLREALTSQICPFTEKKCIKTRKSNPNIAIGTCSVKYQDKDIIICPFRLLEKKQIFLDCIHLLTLHEPGNELYVIPEVNLPGGNVDYFLVSAKDAKVKDFVGIELQTMDTTGTVWPERQRLLHSYGFETIKEDIENVRSFGMNWKMTAKTILIQMHHKAKTFETLNKHLVLIIQEPFFKYMNKEFNFSHIQSAKLGDCVHFHSYDFIFFENKMKLDLTNRVSTDTDGIGKCLGLKAESNIELETIMRILESKLSEKYRLSL
jgi:hypothetical protein